MSFAILFWGLLVSRIICEFQCCKVGNLIYFWMNIFILPRHGYFFFLFVFLGPHPRHMDVPRVGTELELWPLAYATATATQDPSQVCDLHHSSRQHQVLNPLS